MRQLKVCLVLCLLTARAASAQVPTGTVSGSVKDPQGLALPGVTVAVTSPQLQGARATVTSANGDFLIPLLPPGAYTAVFEIAGFEKVTKFVVVAGTQVVSLAVSMAVSGITEAVEVVAHATPFANTAQVATGFTQDLVATLPGNRSLDATLLLLAPSVHPTGPSGGYSIAGAPSYENLFAVNGVVITENMRGQPYTLYVEDALQETTVATAGISAEYGRFSGGIVNAITKSGGNLFSGSYRQSFNNDAWRSKTPFNEAQLDRVVPTYEYTLGGPVATNRLWFFTAGRLQKQESSRTLAATAIPYVRTDDEKRFEGKLTYSLNGKGTIVGSYGRINQLYTNLVFQNAMDTASFYNQGQPQDLLSLHYSGIVSSNLFVEAQYSRRSFAFTGAGATSTDLIDGTLLVDRSRGGTSFRYHAATFCGVCDDEDRNNDDLILKASYFKTSTRLGSHSVVVGYDRYTDHRFSNNHQSGSDYRILGTGTIMRGTDIFPVFAPGSTIIQWNPIDASSQGTDLVTHSVFANDRWRMSDRFTFNLGVRWDGNQGTDAAGNRISDSRAISPRLGVVFDPTADGKWSMSGSYSKYVASLNTGIAENSAGGNPALYQFVYQGPSINADPSTATPVTQSDAIRQVFAWYNASGGPSLPAVVVDIPGISSKIGDTLDSPSVLETAVGVGREIGRGSVRADFVYRTFADFYASVTNASTGKVTDPAGQPFDLTLIENANVDSRTYKGLSVQSTYRFPYGVHVGGHYTLSRLRGTFDGENAASGPLTTSLLSYPEFVESRWNSPEGDLAADQRHRVRLWSTYDVPLPNSRAGALTLGAIHQFSSGVPYGAVGPVNTLPYVSGTNYLNPSGNRTDGLWDYYFTARDAYRTEGSSRTDLSINYAYEIPVAGRRVEAFFHGDIVNVFNVSDLCGCGSTVFKNGGIVDIGKINTGVLAPGNSGTAAPFNPFTSTPVEGVNWNKRPTFGTAVDQFSYTTPRAFRFSVGLRF